MACEAFFLPATSGQRYCLFHRPATEEAARGALVYVHPFAEEMNKARRMAAVQARALAAAGYAVLQIDLHGCGDSSGDFADASWAGWLDDVELACVWLRARCAAPLWLWGLRSGCLLAAEAAQRGAPPAGLLFWQPVVSGKQHLQQFLRLKTAGAILGGAGERAENEAAGGAERATGKSAAGGTAGGATDRLRRQLAQGETVEVAGYVLAPALAGGLERSELLPPPPASRCEWIELAARPTAPLSPAAELRLARWRAAGHAVRGTVVAGPAFWQTSEIEEAPALLDATLRVLAQAGAECAVGDDAGGGAEDGAGFVTGEGCGKRAGNGFGKDSSEDSGQDSVRPSSAASKGEGEAAPA